MNPTSWRLFDGGTFCIHFSQPAHHYLPEGSTSWHLLDGYFAFMSTSWHLLDEYLAFISTSWHLYWMGTWHLFQPAGIYWMGTLHLFQPAGIYWMGTLHLFQTASNTSLCWMLTFTLLLTVSTRGICTASKDRCSRDSEHVPRGFTPATLLVSTVRGFLPHATSIGADVFFFLIKGE